MDQAEFSQHVGTENICPSIEKALERARTLYLQAGQESLLPVGGTTSGVTGNH